MLTRPPPIICGVANALKVQAKAVGDAGNDAGHGQRQRHGQEGAHRPGAEAYRAARW